MHPTLDLDQLTMFKSIKYSKKIIPAPWGIFFHLESMEEPGHPQVCLKEMFDL